MAKFKDRLDREWSLEIDLSMLAPLREAGLNVGEVMRDPKLFSGFTFETLGGVLWVLCAEQARAAGLDEVAFAKGFNGMVLHEAGDALWSALVDFHQRPAVAAAIKKGLPALMQKAEAEQVAKIEREFQKAASLSVTTLGETNSGSNGSAGGSPESSASTPAS